MLIAGIKNTCTKHEFLNGYFERTHQWDLKGEIADGVIVQKIIRTLNTNCPDYNKINAKYNHSYFEYWKVAKGKVEKKKGYCYDDCWSYGQIYKNNLCGMLTDCKEKYGVVGKTQIQGVVYFIPTTHNRYMEILETFKNGAVEYAGELPAKKSIDYESELGESITYSYEHDWDFSTDDKFYDGVKELVDYCGLKTLLDSFANISIYSDLKKYLFP